MPNTNPRKGTQFTRVLQYFRTADVAEAQACLNACVQEVGARRKAVAEDGPVPRPKRHRRTKAELLAAKGAANGGASESLANA